MGLDGATSFILRMIHVAINFFRAGKTLVVRNSSEFFRYEIEIGKDALRCWCSLINLFRRILKRCILRSVSKKLSDCTVECDKSVVDLDSRKLDPMIMCFPEEPSHSLN